MRADFLAVRYKSEVQRGPVYGPCPCVAHRTRSSNRSNFERFYKELSRLLPRQGINDGDRKRCEGSQRTLLRSI